MKYGCPNPNCPCHKKTCKIVKNGSYFRTSDSRTIHRFKCKSCGKNFSHATFSICYRQKKRRVNEPLFNLLASGVSMRRAAKVLKVNRTTVERKLLFLAKKARISTEKFLEKIKGSVSSMQFDDLLTIEHTKMKPLTVSIAVDKKRRFILGARVSQIPAFGLLAEKSRKKYGHRKSFHREGLDKLFLDIKKTLTPKALIESDEHPFYSDSVSKHFPQGNHRRYKGGRGCIAGQGELKKLHFDPLFTLNHTCAMFRANINRLIRKTWCSTKDPKRLQAHIDLFIHYYNSKIL